MKIDLNPKEFVALFGLLERNSPYVDPKLDQVHKRVTSILVSSLSDLDQEKAERWFAMMQNRVNDLTMQNNMIVSNIPSMTVQPKVEHQPILTDDDGEITSDSHYPKKSGYSSNKNRKRRH